MADTKSLLNIYQLILRQFIGNDQYTHNLSLSYVKNDDNNVQSENVDGEKNIADKFQELANLEKSSLCVLTLTRRYTYPPFVFNGHTVDVTIVISKTVTCYPSQITKNTQHSWKRVPDEVTFECSNDDFKKYVDLGIFLNSPNLKDYNNLNIVRTGYGKIVTNDTAYPAYNYYKTHEKVSQSVRVSHLDTFDRITDGYIATIKYDGIHHIVSISKGSRYVYVKRDFSDTGFFVDLGEGEEASTSAILSTELLDGVFHILDIYVYFNDNQIMNKPYKERFDKFSTIDLPETLFDKVIIITGEIMNGADTDLLEKFLQLYPVPSMIMDIRSELSIPYDIKFYDYKNEIRKITNESQKAKDYYNAMKEYLRPSDRGMQLAARYGVPNVWLYLLSPAIVESLIIAFFQFGAVPKYWENVKEYMKSITMISSLDKLYSMRYNVINEWDTYVKDDFPTDGIVFYRNSALIMNSYRPQLIKWKPKNTLTVDVIIDYNPDTIVDTIIDDNNMNIPVVQCTLKCRKYDETTQSYTFDEYKNIYGQTQTFLVKLDNFNRTRPRCKNGNIVIPGISITEVLIKDGFVEPYRVRYDKTNPNSCTLLKSVYNNKQPSML